MRRVAMIITRDKSFYRNLFSLAIPISFQYLITFGVGFADNLMVGSLGEGALSGVYIGNQVQTLLQLFVGGVEGAILILAAQYWGKRDTESIRKVVSIGVKFAALLGLIISIIAVLFPTQIVSLFTAEENVVREGGEYLFIVGFSYVFFCIAQVMISSMRAVETAKIGLYISIVALFTNIGLNFVLIYGMFGLPAMGVKGAALATLISRVIEASIIVIYVLKADKKLCFKLSDLKHIDKLLVKDFFRYGLPIIGGNLVWSINMMANTRILGSYNNAGVIAATSIAGMLNNLIYVWMNGLSSSVGIITGKTVGAGEYEKMKTYAKTVQVMFLSVGLISGLLVFLLRDPFISLYETTPEGAEFSRQFINVLSITIIGSCYQAASLFGLVKSGGDISFVFKMDTIAVFCVVLPSAIIAYFSGAAPWIVFACLKCDQILKCFVAVVKINRFNWMKNLTRDRRENADESA